MSRLIQALIIARAPIISEKMRTVGLFSGSDIKGAWFHFNHLSVVERGCGDPYSDPVFGFLRMTSRPQVCPIARNAAKAMSSKDF
jgi:hypothetical protein